MHQHDDDPFTAAPDKQDAWTPARRLAHQLRMAQRHQHRNVVIRTEDLATAIAALPAEPSTP